MFDGSALVYHPGWLSPLLLASASVLMSDWSGVQDRISPRDM